jgi:hypothetical protein
LNKEGEKEEHSPHSENYDMPNKVVNLKGTTVKEKENKQMNLLKKNDLS